MPFSFNLLNYNVREVTFQQNAANINNKIEKTINTIPAFFLLLIKSLIAWSAFIIAPETKIEGNNTLRILAQNIIQANKATITTVIIKIMKSIVVFDFL